MCLKGYYEWKQAGGIGVWKYGGTVRITSCPKGSPSSFGGSDSADESVDDSESSQFDQLLEFLHLSGEVSLEESNTANILTFLFDRFGLGLLQAYLMERNGVEDFPLNSMVGNRCCAEESSQELLWIAGFSEQSGNSSDFIIHIFLCNTNYRCRRMW